MNVIEKLEANGINIGIKYYGLDDLSTGITVKYLLDGKKIILNCYRDKNIISIDDYINYVFINFIMNFEEVISYVKENKQQEFKEFLKRCQSIYKKYEIEEVIKYLKKSYKNVYDYDVLDKNTCFVLDLKNYTSVFIAEHFSSFNEDVITYIINEETYNKKYK